ncbi:MAG: PAS domain S-box protein [Planctomycetaceae bacterium]|nr:PAS domain S-box protein [Planctomycetaceae bacterium]
MIKILLVEDNESDIILTRKMLSGYSRRVRFSVDSATTLKQAVECLSGDEKRYDVVLLDMGLPDSNGLETIQRVSQANPYVPIVVLTGLSDEETGLATIQNGASDYLVKDKLSPDILVRTVLFSIERKQSEEEREKMLFFQLGLNSLQQSLLKNSPLEERLKRVTDDIIQYFDVDFCRLWLVRNGDKCETCMHAQTNDPIHVCQNREKCLHMVSSSGRYTNIDGPVHGRVPIGCYKIGKIASREEHKFHIKDAQTDVNVLDNQWAKELGLKSFAGYQLCLEGGDVLGVLGLFSQKIIEPCEEAMLDVISSNVAMTVHQSIMSEQIRESEERYRELFDGSNDALMTMEPLSWNFTSCNRATLKLFRVSDAEQFKKLTLWELSPEYQPDGNLSSVRGREMVERALKEGSAYFEWLHKRLDGEELYTTILLTRIEKAGVHFIHATVRDITESKIAEEELRWKSALLESQVEASLDGVFVADKLGQKVLINKRLIHMWNIPYELIENQDTGLFLKYSADIAENPTQVLEKIKYLGEHPHETSRDEIEYKDGTVLDMYSSPITDKVGKHLGRIWTFRDITDRKKAEIAIKQNATVINSIFLAAPVGITLMKKRIFSKMNDLFAEIPGYSREELIGQSSLMLYPDRNEYEKVGMGLYTNLFKNGRNSVESKWRRKDGTLVDILLNSSPLDVNDPMMGEVVTVLDISDLKRSQEAILRERNKAQSYLDVAGVIMLVLNEDLTVHRINNKGCEILGYEEHDIIDRNWCDKCIPEEFRNDTRDIYNLIFKGKVEDFEYHEGTVLAKDGKRRLVAWHNSVLKDKKGNIKSILSSGEDITERKEAEEAIKKAYKELEKANSDLKNMQMQIIQSEKLASIGQLAAGVAHEMNTPVGFVACNFETLEKYLEKFKKLLEMYNHLSLEAPNLEKNKILDHYETIKKMAQDMKIDFIIEDIESLFSESKEGLTRVTTIIQNLRDFSRIDQIESFDQFDLNHGIESTLAVARNTIKYQANVITEFADIPKVMCTGSQINQVLLNILVNAAHAIESQQMDEMGTVKIRTYADEDYVSCEIEDNGPGIPPEYLKKIYEPFFTTKPAGKGTGLGLSVSYDIIVNKHKGELQVDSTLGKGTKFTIKLPLKTTIDTQHLENQISVDAANQENIGERV